MSTVSSLLRYASERQFLSVSRNVSSSQSPHSADMAASPFNRPIVADGEGETNEQQAPQLRAVTSRSPPSPDLLSTATAANMSTSLYASSTNGVRSERGLSLSQPSIASFSDDPSPSTSLAANVLRKRKAPSPPSHTARSSSASPAHSPTSPYSWLFDLSPQLFPSTTVLVAGQRPFEWLNTVDCTSPLDYLHSSHNIVHPSARCEEFKYDNKEDSCDCDQPTQCMQDCPCSRYTEAMHTRDGLRRRTANGATIPPPPAHSAIITECNDNCRCARWRKPTRCLNRVVQSAPVNPLHSLLVFRTADRGWGALALRPIPARSYVCEYIGELISDTLAESRSDKYLFSSDPKLITGDRWVLSSSVEPPTIDATQVGHIARFINHSCAPNCSVYQVMLDGREPLKPHFAFFSIRDIAAGEELTIDYSYPLEHRQRLFGGPCRCGHCDGKEADASSANREEAAASDSGRGRSGAEGGSSKKRAAG